jgi:hypothetical protein
VKTTKNLLALLLSLALLLCITGGTAFSVPDGDPSIRIAQEDGGNGNYKLVITVKASEAVGPIFIANVAVSYDNTIIVPVNADTGAIIADTLTDQKTPFKTSLDSILNPIWETTGSKTTFDVAAMSFPAQDISAGVVAVEYYFALQNDKTIEDMNSGTFTLVLGPSLVNASAFLGAEDGTMYYLDYSQNYDADNKELFLDSIAYANSTVKPDYPPTVDDAATDGDESEEAAVDGTTTADDVTSTDGIIPAEGATPANSPIILDDPEAASGQQPIQLPAANSNSPNYLPLLLLLLIIPLAIVLVLLIKGKIKLRK